MANKGTLGCAFFVALTAPQLKQEFLLQLGWLYGPLYNGSKIPVLAVNDTAFISTATSSQRSPLPLAVQLHVTLRLVGTSVELEAPVILFVDEVGTLTSHCCEQVGEESVTPPNID